MNVTQQYEYSRIIWKYTPPTIIFIGTIGHILTITAVNYHCRKATSFSVYLTALAVVDLIVLYTLTLNNWLLYAFDVSVKESGRAMCKLNYFLSFCLPHLSSWNVMCLTGERVFCIYLSKKASHLPGPRVGLLVIGAIVLFLCALNAHTLYGRDLQETAKDPFCGFVDNDYKDFFYTYWNKIHFVVYFALPVTVIVLGNSAIVVKLFRSARAFEGSIWSSADKRARQVLLITLLISVAFIVLVSPLPLLFFIAPVRVLELSATIFFQMIYVNHAINFWLYVISGSRFTNDLKTAFGRCLCRNTEQETAVPAEGSQGTRDTFSNLE